MDHIGKFNSQLEILMEKTFKDADHKIIPFDHTKLANYMNELSILYTTYLIHEFNKEQKEKIRNPFNFKNLSFESFTWESFFRSLNIPDGPVRKNLSKNIIFDKCQITKMTFSNGSVYDSRTFNAIFKECTIDGATFSLDSLNNMKSLLFEKTSFKELIFSRPNTHVNFYFSDCTILGKVECENSCEFNIISFNKCQFRKGPKEKDCISFNNTKFKNTTVFETCDFYASPKFHESEIHSDTSFHGSKFHDLNSKQAVADYRILKQKLHQIGDEHQSIEFHALEMDARRKTLLPRLWHIFSRAWLLTVSSWCLKITNDYGRSYLRPLLILIAVTLIFSAIYWHFQGIEIDTQKAKTAEPWLFMYALNHAPQSFGTCFVFSFQKALGPLGILFDSGLLVARTLNMKLLSILQFIFSSMLWYLLIIQTRRQFRL